MASIEEAMSAGLGGYGPIQAVVSDRVYDTILPPASPLPAITFQMLGDRERPHSTGLAASHPYFVQVDGWARTAAERRALWLAIRDRMQTLRGNFGGLVVHRCLRDIPPFNTIEPSLDGGPTPIHRVVSRWTAHVAEPSAVTL